MCGSISKPKSIPITRSSRPGRSASSRCCWTCSRPRISDRVTIQSFDWRTLQLVQKLAPTIPTVYLTVQRGPGATISLDKASEWTAGFNPAEHAHSLPQTIKAAGGAIWSPYFGDVDAGLISESHRLGLAVVVWTVNQPADIARMIAIGVDGIISDRPDALRQAAGEAGVTLPTGSPATP
jgi:glycerophosphoryl diester phosphodiesterase